MPTAIRAYRKLAELSQHELGQRMRPPRSQGWICKAELGLRGARISDADAEALSRALNIPPEKIIATDGER
jgi:transcriptional regulator with XRE-family HTH domain